MSIACFLHITWSKFPSFEAGHQNTPSIGCCSSPSLTFLKSCQNCNQKVCLVGFRTIHHWSSLYRGGHLLLDTVNSRCSWRPSVWAGCPGWSRRPAPESGFRRSWSCRKPAPARAPAARTGWPADSGCTQCTEETAGQCGRFKIPDL